MSWLYPILRPRVTSPYGWRILNGEQQFHQGIDFISEDGNDSILAVADGTIIHDQDSYDEAKRWIGSAPDSAGRFIIIQHEYKGQIYFARYLHLQENCVSLGEKVVAGQRIGTEGNLGFSYGKHLHFDVFSSPSWTPVDPTNFFKE